MARIIRWLFLAAMLLGISGLDAATYYFDMSTSGNDSNPCTVAQPCRNVSKANSQGAANDTLLFKCGSGSGQSVNAQLLAKNGQKIGPYGTCTTATLPIFDGTGLAISGDSGLVKIPSGANNVIIEGLILRDSPRSGILIDGNGTSPSGTQIRSVEITNSATSADGRSILNRDAVSTTIFNLYSHDNNKQNQPCLGSKDLTLTSSTFTNTANDPTFGCSNTVNTGGLHRITQNIIRDNPGTSRTLVQLQVDNTGGLPLAVRNEEFMYNLIEQADQDSTSLRIVNNTETNNPNVKPWPNPDNNTNEQTVFNIKVRNNLMIDGSGDCVQLDDNRPDPDPTDWDELYFDENVCIGNGGQRINLGGLAFDSMARNVWDSAGGTGGSEGTAFQEISVAAMKFENVANRNFNLADNTSPLYRASGDGVRNLGPMQTPYLGSNAAVITNADKNAVVFTFTTVFPIQDVGVVSSVIPDASHITTVYNTPGCDYSGGTWITAGSARTNTGCTINGNTLTLTFDGAPVTEAQSVTYSIPKNKIRAGQLGSSLASGMTRHYNVAMSGSVINQVTGDGGQTGPAIVSCRTPNDDRDAVRFSWDQNIDPATGATGYSCTLAGSPWTKDGNAARDCCAKVHAQDFTTEAASGQAIVCSYTPGNVIATTGGVAAQAFANRQCTNEVTAPPIPPDLVGISVNDTEPATLVFSFNSGVPPMLPATNCHTGWSCERNGTPLTISACTRTDNNTFEMSSSPAFTSDNDTGSCDYDPSTGNTTNSTPTALLTVADRPITVNFPQGTVIRTQTQVRWMEFSRLGEWKKPINTQAEIVAGGRILGVFQMQITGADEITATAHKLQCRLNNGAFADVTDAPNFGAIGIAFTPPFPGTFSDQDAIVISLLGDPGGGGSFVTGRFHSTSLLFPPMAREENNYTEEAYSLKTSPSLSVSDTIACRLVLANGGVFDTYTLASLIIRQSLASGAN